jgi:hypothetical protein
MTAGYIGTTWKRTFVAIAFLIFFIPLFSGSTPAAMNQLLERPIDVIKAYLKSTHAHDFRTAYRYISTIDKDIRAEKEYIGSEPNFSGFALELAKKLADDMKIWVIKEKKNQPRSASKLVTASQAAMKSPRNYSIGILTSSTPSQPRSSVACSKRWTALKIAAK